MKKYNSELSRVEQLHVELGYQCNIRCIMCEQCDASKKLNKEIWQKKLVPVYPHLKYLIIQGGEITIMPEAKEMISLVKSHNPKIKLGIMTNGLRFDEYWQHEFVKNGFMVNFSLNAATKETYKRVCLYSNFELVMKNLKALLAASKKSKNRLLIFISFVIRPENITEMADFIKLGEKLKVDKVRFFFDSTTLPDDEKQVEKCLSHAWAEVENAKVKVEGLSGFYRYYCQRKKIENEFLKKIDEDAKWKASKCTDPWQAMYVKQPGEVMSCCKSSLALGNLNEESIEEIWNGKKARRLREYVDKGNFSFCQLNCPFVVRPPTLMEKVKGVLLLPA